MGHLSVTHARKFLPAALASVSFGFVLVQVRVRSFMQLVVVSLQLDKPP
jgi:hypothetical protein